MSITRETLDEPELQTNISDESNKQEDMGWAQFKGKFAKDLHTPNAIPQIERFLQEVVNMVMQYLQKQCDPTTKVLDFHHPHQLREMMDHCLDVHETPRDLEQILSDCKETLTYCVKSGHPHFFNQITTAQDLVGLAGEWLSTAANNYMMTYEIAPVFTLMENVILTRMLGMIGWTGGEGMFSPGGALANFYAMLAARHKVCPLVNQKGLFDIQPLVAFTSEQSHYSIKRAALHLGLGTDNVINIECDRRGKMIPSDLEDKIAVAKIAGKKPFFVNATCGSTVLGAYDSLDEIADICERHDMWMHCDGAWGGTVIFSKDKRHLCKGLSRADSMTWDPHKMMCVPIQCSVILLKDKGLLEAVNKMGADYLFQTDKHYDMSFNTGDKSIQCGRRNDIFKLWLMWRAKGDNGFEDHVDQLYSVATYLRNSIKERRSFQLVLEEFEAPNVCFWFIPEAMRSMAAGPERDQELNKVAPKLKSLMMEKGTMMIQYQPLGSLPNFFRVAVSNPWLTVDDMDFMLDELERLAEEM